MIIWLSVLAWADPPSITLGAGRIAVLDPGVRPSEITSSVPTVVDVVHSPPNLLLVALGAGMSKITVRSASGEQVWTVKVEPNGTVAPTGGPGLAPPGDVLSLPIRGGALCKVPGAGTYTRVDEPFAQMFPFGTARWFVQLDKPGTQDIAFELANAKPRVMTLTPAAPGGTPPELPAGCIRAAETVKMLVGDELNLKVGRKLKAILVGSPSVVYVAPTDGTSDHVSLRGLEPGTTTILVRATDDEDPWMRTVVVARAP